MSNRRIPRTTKAAKKAIANAVREAVRAELERHEHTKDAAPAALNEKPPKLREPAGEPTDPSVTLTLEELTRIMGEGAGYGRPDSAANLALNLISAHVSELLVWAHALESAQDVEHVRTDLARALFDSWRRFSAAEDVIARLHRESEVSHG